MGLYQAVAGAKITAAEWNTIYNLLKGVVGGEDPIKLLYNGEGALTLQPNPAPASVVKTFRLATAGGIIKFALRSDGVLVLADQAGTPGSLEAGLIWRNGTQFYGYTGGATVELGPRQRTKELWVPVGTIQPDTAVFSLFGTEPNALKTIGFADGSTQYAGASLVLPSDYVAGTSISVRLYWTTTGVTGVCRWVVRYLVVADHANVAAGGDGTELTPLDLTVPGTYKMDVGTFANTITGYALPNMLRLTISREGAHANDTLTAGAFLIGLALVYTAED